MRPAGKRCLASKPEYISSYVLQWPLCPLQWCFPGCQECGHRRARNPVPGEALSILSGLMSLKLLSQLIIGRPQRVVGFGKRVVI